MRRPLRPAALLPLPLAALLPLAAALALAGCATGGDSTELRRAGELYQWTDASGGVRYTSHADRVPVAHQHTRKLVVPGALAPERPAPARSAPPAAPPPVDAPPVASPLEARIAELETRIAEDEEALKVLISDPKLADTLRGSPELREIGDRLPALQAELRALREQQKSEAASEADADEPAGESRDGS